MGKPWNPQQQKFCDVYLANGYKATDAYRVAYPEEKNHARQRAAPTE